MVLKNTLFGNLFRPFAAILVTGALFGSCDNVEPDAAPALTTKFDLMLQTTFNYSLQVDNRINAPFYVKPYGMGLNLGIYWHLGHTN